MGLIYEADLSWQRLLLNSSESVITREPPWVFQKVAVLALCLLPPVNQQERRDFLQSGQFTRQDRDEGDCPVPAPG